MRQENGCGYEACSEEIKALLDAAVISSASPTERKETVFCCQKSNGEREGGLFPLLLFHELKQGRVIITESTSQGLVLSEFLQSQLNPVTRV